MPVGGVGGLSLPQHPPPTETVVNRRSASDPEDKFQGGSANDRSARLSGRQGSYSCACVEVMAVRIICVSFRRLP